jgi:hypothetical protein
MMGISNVRDCGRVSGGMACLSPRNFFSKRIRRLKFIERLAEEVTVELA